MDTFEVSLSIYPFPIHKNAVSASEIINPDIVAVVHDGTVPAAHVCVGKAHAIVL